MKKWYFSINGEISSPMDLEEATVYAQQNPDVYGWHPSFTQWRPVTMITELGNIVSNQAPPVNPLTELVEKFKIKKQRLDKKLTIIDERIANNESLLSTLHAEIEQYKKVTANLSEGVKGAISKLEQQYLSMQEKQTRLNEAASIASMEINTLVNEFKHRMAGKDSAPQDSESVSAEEQAAEEFLVDNVDESLLGQAPTKNADVAQTKVKLVDVNANSEKAPESKVKTIAKDVLIDEAIDEDDQNQNEDGKSFGVKSLFKSVFKGDEEQSEIQGNSLSKMLAMEEENAKLAVNQSPIESDDSQSLSEDDDMAKKARRRTRRRR